MLYHAESFHLVGFFTYIPFSVVLVRKSSFSYSFVFLDASIIIIVVVFEIVNSYYYYSYCSLHVL